MPSGVYERKPEHNKNISKGVKKHLPRTVFKKGNISWNKGKKLPRGKDAYNWRGGETKDTRGYILIYQPFHPRANHQGYARRGHLVMEKHINRFLKPNEIVHHINKIITDDRIENLILFNNQSEHRRFHCNP